MHRFKLFVQEMIGKKKNNWTFVSWKYVESNKKDSRLMVLMCKCDCGIIKQYPVYICASHHFPQQCIKCSRNKKKLNWFRERKAQESYDEEELWLPDINEEYDCVAIYADKYKKYYRD